MTSATYNSEKNEEFKEYCAKEGNEMVAKEMHQLHTATKAWLKKHVANRDVWHGYRADLLTDIRDENAKLRTSTAAV